MRVAHMCCMNLSTGENIMSIVVDAGVTSLDEAEYMSKFAHSLMTSIESSFIDSKERL